MSDQELIQSGFNIDTRYRSQVKNLRTSESEYEYYIRSKETMKKIIKLHRKTGGTILIVAHAPSLEVLTRHLMNGQPRPEQLTDLSARVGYCSMTIVDAEPSSKTWQFRYSLDEHTNWQQQQLEQTNNILARSASITYQPMAVSQFGYLLQL
jgi:broad specificity phosphatase PhoE